MRSGVSPTAVAASAAAVTLVLAMSPAQGVTPPMSPASGVTPPVTWTTQPSANPSSTDNELFATAATSSRAWAAGTTHQSGRYKTLVEQHTAVGWIVEPTPNRTGNDFLDGLAATSKTNAWAVGYHHTLALGTAVLIQHYNGSTWSDVSAPRMKLHRPGPGQAPTSYLLAAVTALSASDVWAVGEHGCENIGCGEWPLTEHYNGHTWTQIPALKPLSNADLFGVAGLNSTHVWAVGSNDSNETPVILGWGGKAWHLVTAPSPGTDGILYGVTARSSKSIWAVGSYRRTAHRITRPLILHRVGGVWKLVPSPSKGHLSQLTAVAATSAGNVWAVGDYLSSAGIERTLIEHFDGSSWSIQPSPNTTPFGNTLLGVAARSATTAFAVGGALTATQAHPQTLAMGTG
jgi:hypothetical protein